MSKIFTISLFLITIIVSLQVRAQTEHSKLPLVTASFEDEPLIKVLKKIKKKYKIRFAYDHKLLIPYKVNQVCENLKLEDAIAQVLEGTSLRFKINGRNILILPPPSVENQTAAPAIKRTSAISLRGVIKDDQTGETLPFATIRVLGTKMGTNSNADGFFSLLSIPAHAEMIEVSYLGYMHKMIPIEAHLNGEQVVISLSSKAKVLPELVVEESENQMINSGENISQLSINPSKLLSLPSLGEVDIFRTLQYLPGISGTDETSAGLIIRGSTPDQNLILFDGFSIYHIDHFFGVFSAFNSNAIKNIQVYKGAFESKYGGRVSSVIDITGKTGNTVKPSYGFGANLISGNAVLELPIGKKLSLFVAGRRSHTDILKTGLYKNIFDRVIIDNRDIINNLKDRQFEDIEPEFNFYDLNAKLTYRPSERDFVSFSYYSGRDNLDINARQQFSELLVDNNNNVAFTANIDWDVQDEASWGNNGVSMRWGRQWNQKFYSNLNFAYSDYQSEENNIEKYRVEIPVLEIDTLLSNRRQRISNSLSNFSLRWDNELKLGNNSRFAFGTLYTKNRINFQFTFNDEQVDNYNENGELFSIYAQNTFQLFSNLDLTLGLRNNHYDVLKQNFIEPRASLNYKVTNKLKFKAAWGKNNQFINRINFEENYSDVSSGFWLVSDGENIPHVSSEHFVAGFTYETDKFLFDLEAYHKDTQGIIDFLPNVRFDENGQEVLVDVYFEGESVAKGIDVLVQKKTGKHTGWLSYSLSSVENSFPELNRGRPFSARQDQRHEIKLVNMLKLGKWDLSSTWVYGSGKPYSDPSNGTPLVLFDSLNTFQYVAADNINTERLPDYHRLDIAAAYNFKIGHGNAQFGLSIYNAYGRKNIKYKVFSNLDLDEFTSETVNSNPVYLSSDVLLLGFTPNLFFNFKF